MKVSLIRFLRSQRLSPLAHPTGDTPFGAYLCDPSHSAGVVGTRLVGTASFPAFLPAERYARRRLPSRGSRGPRFPTFLGTMIRADCREPISGAFGAPSPPPLPCITPLSLCPFSAEQARVSGWSCLATPGVFHHPGRRSSCLTRPKETIGSPTFPGYPHAPMRWSPTPGVSCPRALSPSGLLPAVPRHAVGLPLPVSREALRRTTTLPIAGLNTGPAGVLPPASDSRYRADPRTSRRTGGRDVSQGGLGSTQRPAPTGEHYRVSWAFAQSQRSGFTLARAAVCSAPFLFASSWCSSHRSPHRFQTPSEPRRPWISSESAA